MKYRRFGTFLLVALLSVTLLAPGNRSVPPASAQGQAQREPLDYFREMMPVFTHDRCINCHGEVDPFTNRDHEGGQIEPDSTRSCTKSGCHSQANNTDQDRNNDWRVAPAAVLFVKPAGSGFVRKDEKELCEQMADRVANLGATEFRHHLKDDIPIELGFQGMSAGARDGPPARPTMPKAEFLRVADAWLNDGFGVCEREGTIIRTEDIKSDTTYAPTDPEGQGHEVRVQQSGRRVVNIRFANGRFETNVTVSGAVINTQTIRGVLPNGDSCTTIITGALPA
jgi:hypothetical protein